MPQYSCSVCRYNTTLKGNHRQHLKSKKHINNELLYNQYQNKKNLQIKSAAKNIEPEYRKNLDELLRSNIIVNNNSDKQNTNTENQNLPNNKPITHKTSNTIDDKYMVLENKIDKLTDLINKKNDKFEDSMRDLHRILWKLNKTHGLDLDVI